MGAVKQMQIENEELRELLLEACEYVHRDTLREWRQPGSVKLYARIAAFLKRTMKCSEHPDRDGMAPWGEEWLCGECSDMVARKIERFLNVYKAVRDWHE